MTQRSLSPEPEAALAPIIRRHLLEGWGGLLLFTCLGVALECLLAFKVPIYVDVESETRRLMWRLAHAHGTLLSLVHLAAAFSFSRFSLPTGPRPLGLCSGCLSGAGLLIPGGFFLAGLGAHDGDPGLSIALVPMGALLLVTGLALLAWESYRMTYTRPPSRKASARED